MQKLLATFLSATVLSVALSMSAQALVLELSGEVTEASGAIAALLSPGDPIVGPINVNDVSIIGPGDINSIDVNVGDFCFSTGSPSACPSGGIDVSITSIDALRSTSPHSAER